MSLVVLTLLGGEKHHQEPKYKKGCKRAFFQFQLLNDEITSAQNHSRLIDIPEETD